MIGAICVPLRGGALAVTPVGSELADVGVLSRAGAAPVSSTSEVPAELRREWDVTSRRLGASRFNGSAASIAVNGRTEARRPSARVMSRMVARSDMQKPSVAIEPTIRKPTATFPTGSSSSSGREDGRVLGISLRTLAQKVEQLTPGGSIEPFPPPHSWQSIDSQSESADALALWSSSSIRIATENSRSPASAIAVMTGARVARAAQRSRARTRRRYCAFVRCAHNTPPTPSSIMCGATSVAAARLNAARLLAAVGSLNASPPGPQCSTGGTRMCCKSEGIDMRSTSSLCTTVQR
mmetsp:Transcript_9295/g.28135  ORF Transcript_9295/g.28135 Transcript_9295/m.28135 type:complete len:295 (+) Transcript_9295:1493-2377(+)